VSVYRYEEVPFDGVKIFKQCLHLLIESPLLQISLAKFFVELKRLLLDSDLLALKLTVINVPKHHKPLLAEPLDSVDGVVATLAVLVHYILAEAIVPGLELVPYDLIHLEATFDVTVAVEPTPLVVSYYVAGGINVAVA